MMNMQSNTVIKVYAAATVVMVPLVAAAFFTPAGFPMLLRQILLCAWGVGATLVAERLLFSRSWRQAWQAVGFVRTRRSALVVAVLASLPMWLFLPILAGLMGVPIQVPPDWVSLLLGAILVNGITEEVLHRGFVFGHLQQEYSFMRAATLGALLFAAQHLYLIISQGWVAGLAAVVLAALLVFPLSYIFARGGNSLAGPALLHTSSNAPMLILTLPPAFVTAALLPHMAVVLGSYYLVFVLYRFQARTAVKAVAR